MPLARSSAPCSRHKTHGSTFAGNLLGAAAGLATIGVIEREDLLVNAEARGEQLRRQIRACGNPLFESVRGRGLLNAIVLTHPCAHAAMDWALEHGLIINAVAPNAPTSRTAARGERERC